MKNLFGETQKDFTKDFKVLADYCYTQQDRVYANHIVWNENIMFATCGTALLWQTTERNPEDFTVFTVNKGKIEKEEDEDQIAALKKAGLEQRVFGHFCNYDSSFDMTWDKQIPLPSKLISSKKDRSNDRVYFNLKDNELMIDFDAFKAETNVKATYGDFFSNVQGDVSDIFGLQLWIVYNLLKINKDQTIHFDYNTKDRYLKIKAGKWNCISTVLKM